VIATRPADMVSVRNMMDEAKPWGLAVYAIIRDEAGRVLILRRSKMNRNFVGAWEFPGGKQDAGESVDASIIRETREEAGIEICVTGLAGATEFEAPEIRVVMLFFHARWVSGEAQVSGEHDEALWAGPEALGSLELRPQVAEFLRQWPLH